VTQVELAGGVALLVPPRPDADAAWAAGVLGRLDGLILAGGADLAPARYGRAAHPAAQPARPDRDAAELALCAAAVAGGMPLLGICRGMQVMAVAAGGVLEQHLPDVVGHTGHAPAPATYGRHRVQLATGSRLAGILGDRIEVPSYHHQAVLRHPGYLAAGWDPGDGTLEAMEHPGDGFRLAVQWHPEVSDDGRLFEALVTTCRSRG
jgi:putative glutamine amidotransferase